MGMYDTLLIPFENETLELQSKRFDCILQTYTQGDVVSGAGSGIQIFFDEVDLDDTGKQCNHNSPSSGTLTVFIILVDNVFPDKDRMRPVCHPGEPKASKPTGYSTKHGSASGISSVNTL